MIPWYLLALITAIICLGLIDWRFKLAFFHDRRRTLFTIGAGVALFVLWDALGIFLGIFFHGGSTLTLPFHLFPEFPIEELFFLTLLTYTALIAYRFFSRKEPRS